MSMVALTEAVRDRIRTYLGLTGQEAEMTVARNSDGRPEPASGQVFYGIVGGTERNENNESNETIASRLDFKVVITLKSSYVPSDRQEEELLYKAVASSNTNTGGLWPRARALKTYLWDNRIAIMNEANVLAGGTASLRGFVEPTLFRSISYLGPKGPDWFSAEDNEDGHSDPVVGVAIELVFDRCLFVET